MRRLAAPPCRSKGRRASAGAGERPDRQLAWREGLTAAEVQPYYAEALAIAGALGNMRGATLVTAAYGRALAPAARRRSMSPPSPTSWKARHGQASRASSPAVGHPVPCAAAAGDLRARWPPTTTPWPADQIDERTSRRWASVSCGSGACAQILAMMGRPDEARPLLDALIAADEATVDALHRLLAHATQIDIAWGRRCRAARRHGAVVTALAEKSGNPYLLVYGRGFRRRASALRGDTRRRRATLTETLAYARRRQAGLENEARLLADLACALMHAGQVERARGRRGGSGGGATARRQDLAGLCRVAAARPLVAAVPATVRGDRRPPSGGAGGARTAAARPLGPDAQD